MMNYETVTRPLKGLTRSVKVRTFILHASCFILFFALPALAFAQTAPIYLGGGISAGMNFHSLNLPVYRGDTLCGVFQSGTSVLPNGWILFEKPLGDPAHSFWIAPRLHFNDLGLNTTIPSTDQAQTRNPVDSQLVNVSTINRLNTNILALGADLFFKYPIATRLFFFGGPSV